MSSLNSSNGSNMNDGFNGYRHQLEDAIDKLIEFMPYNSVVVSCRKLLSGRISHEKFLNALNIVGDETDLHIRNSLGHFHFYKDKNTSYISKPLCIATLHRIFNEGITLEQVLDRIEGLPRSIGVQINTKFYRSTLDYKNIIAGIHHDLNRKFSHSGATFLSNDERDLCRLVYKIKECIPYNNRYILYYNEIKRLFNLVGNDDAHLTYKDITLRICQNTRPAYYLRVHTVLNMFDPAHDDQTGLTGVEGVEGINPLSDIIPLFNHYVALIDNEQQDGIQKFTLKYTF